MKERLTLSVREQRRLVVLNEVEKGKMVVREASSGSDLARYWRLHKNTMKKAGRKTLSDFFLDFSPLSEYLKEKGDSHFLPFLINP
jgi:hypothetical protein